MPQQLKPLRRTGRPIPVTERRFLGIVDDRRDDATIVSPLYGWAYSGEKWEPLTSPKPTKWHGAPSKASRGTLWTFNVDYLPGDDQSADEESIEGYQVQLGTERVPLYLTEVLFEKPVEREPRRSRQSGNGLSEHSINRALANAERILDEHFLDLESIRKRYFVEGVTLQFQPQSTVYIVVRDCFTLGPFNFTSDEHNRWRAVANGEVSVLQHLRTSAYQGLHIGDNRRYFVMPHSIPPQQMALADFRDDAQILPDVLSFLNEGALSDSDYGDIVRRIGEHIDIDLSNQAFLYQRLRLQDAAAVVLANNELRANAEREILRIPSIAGLVEQSIENAQVEIRQRLNDELADARAGIEAELSAERDKLDELRRTEGIVNGELAETRAEFERLSARCDEVRGELSQLRSDITPAIDDRMGRIAATVSERLISSAVDALRGSQPVSDSPSHKIETDALRPVYPFHDIAASRGLEDAADAVRQLRKACKTAGIKPEAAILLLASLIDKRVPVVMGPAADVLLSVVGQVLFNGRVINRVVSQLFADFLDLFGRLSVPSKSFCPDADRLADLFVTIAPESLCLVVFDGFNRCEEAVFSPLLRETDGEVSQRLPILSSGFLSGNSPYAQLADMKWPTSVFPVLRHTPDGQPPSVRLWSKTAAVYCEFEEAVGDVKKLKSELYSSTYTEITEASKARYVDAEEITSLHFSTEARNAAMEAYVQYSSLTRLCSVLLACGVTSEVAAALSLEALIVMPLLSYYGATPGLVSKRTEQYERILGIA